MSKSVKSGFEDDRKQSFKFSIFAVQKNTMEIISANYLLSCPNVHKCPSLIRPEYAFIGRSNVGKSSLINMLTGRKQLAKVSGKPGKTQMLNYFLINESWYLVDLPGYGYATVSKSKRNQFRRMIEGYLTQRESLINTFLLIDNNIELQTIDIEFINWMGQMELPFSLVFTKWDKSKPEAAERIFNKNVETLLEHWESMPPLYKTSAKKSLGKDEILSYISNLNKETLEK